MQAVGTRMAVKVSVPRSAVIHASEVEVRASASTLRRARRTPRASSRRSSRHQLGDAVGGQRTLHRAR